MNLDGIILYKLNMEKPEYIIKLTQDLSTMMVSLPKGFDDYLKDRKVTLLYSDSDTSFEDVKFTYKTKLYKTQQGFYLYLLFNKQDVEDMIIYYKQEQLNELTIFITQLIKQFKNATTNNKRT
jgi:hypothetical protein